MTVLERVARAILKCRFYDCEPEAYDNDINKFFAEIDEEHVHNARDEARAAIKELMDFSKDMAVAGETAVDENINYSADTNGSYETYDTMVLATEGFRAMLQHVLDEAET